VVTDADGRVTFISRAVERLFHLRPEAAAHRSWRELLRLGDADARKLQQVLEAVPPLRAKVPVALETAHGRRCLMEVEVHDDPRDASRKIFLLYDMSELYDLRRLLDEKAQFHGLVGHNPSMQMVYRQIRDLAAVDSTVLIEGETGTGKELVARAIHLCSGRRHEPFVPVNCGALTDSLLGSQRFGHRRGAFTGAVEDHKGLFEAADGGTIFLDEIGDVPPATQKALLRVLQEREVLRLGESRPRNVDVRVLVATQHNLLHAVEQGRFRADLLYRIRVARIHLPLLRQRLDDLPLLVASLMAECRAATGHRVESISQPAMQALLGVLLARERRELKSAIESAVIRCRRSLIEIDDLPCSRPTPTWCSASTRAITMWRRSTGTSPTSTRSRSARMSCSGGSPSQTAAGAEVLAGRHGDAGRGSPLAHRPESTAGSHPMK
jgi:transcriptional regulator with PAS, ATPase and Fis domain